MIEQNVFGSPHNREIRVKREGQIKLQIRPVLNPRPSTWSRQPGARQIVGYWDLVKTQISCILDSTCISGKSQ